MILINSSPKDALKIFQPFLPIYVPVGIGNLLAITKREGINAYFVDEQVEDDILGTIRKLTEKIERPYIFGFSVLTAAFKNAITLSEELKKRYPNSFIIFGGVHPTAMPEEVLSYKHIDFVLRGESERSLVELYRSLKDGRDFGLIDNLSFKREDGIVHNKLGLIDDADAFPQFPYHLFTSKRYDLGFLISSRGCPYDCIFCSNRITTGKRYRFKSPETIGEELELLYNNHHKRYALFLDDNFLVSKERVFRLTNEIKKKGLHTKMTFNFQARGDNVSPELLENLYSAGFRSVFFGLETASERIMRVIKKGETVAKCVEAVKMAKEIGFHVSATFIYALPTETHEDRMACARLSRELKIDMARFNNATPYPGTELHKIAVREGRLNIQGLYENFNSVGTFVENPFKKIPFSYIPEGNTEKEIRNDILYSYFLFYFDISKMKRLFTRPSEGVGWFNAGEGLIAMCKKIPSLFFLGFMLFFKFGKFFLNQISGRATYDEKSF